MLNRAWHILVVFFFHFVRLLVVVIVVIVVLLVHRLTKNIRAQKRGRVNPFIYGGLKRKYFRAKKSGLKLGLYLIVMSEISKARERIMMNKRNAEAEQEERPAGQSQRGPRKFTVSSFTHQVESKMTEH